MGKTVFQNMNGESAFPPVTKTAKIVTLFVNLGLV